MEMEGWRCLHNPATPDGVGPHARVRLPRFAFSWCDLPVCITQPREFQHAGVAV